MRSARRVALGLTLPIVIAAAAPAGYAPAGYAPAGYRAGNPPLGLLPSMTPAGEQVVKSGAVVAMSVLGRPDVAILAAPVALDQGGERRTLARGTFLAAASVPGLPGEIEQVFCERNLADAEPVTGQMLLGFAPMPPASASDTRVCLIDTDKDGQFDRALSLGPKGAGKTPYGIPKVEFGLIRGGPIDGQAMVKLRYVGASEDRKSVAFDLEAFGFGRMRALAGGRHSVSIAQLPAHEIIAGAVVTVLSYDARADAATIIINRDLAPGHIVLPEMGG